MPQATSVMNEQVRRAIRHRTHQARTKTQLRVLLFESFQHLQIDPWAVSLDDMKAAVLVAGRAVRQSSGESPLNMPL